MHTKYAASAAAGIWVLTVVTAGMLDRVGSFTGWALLALVAAVPATFLIRWQNGPTQTLSQSIQKALR